jgi:protein-S-isoprenylcysteine O-methyltransferase Ste14
LFKTEKRDRPFVVLASLVFFFALFASLWDFVQIQGVTFRFSSVNTLGLILFIIGYSTRTVGRKTLGKYYSYGLRTMPDQQLIKHGIYGHIRHPIDLAAIIYSLGIPLIFSSFIGFLVMLCLVPLILYRIGIEEKMLIERFGNEYLEYMKKTKRLIPFIY